jgi:hypothetical protein
MVNGLSCISSPVSVSCIFFFVIRNTIQRAREREGGEGKDRERGRIERGEG